MYTYVPDKLATKPAIIVAVSLVYENDWKLILPNSLALLWFLAIYTNQVLATPMRWNCTAVV